MQSAMMNPVIIQHRIVLNSFKIMLLMVWPANRDTDGSTLLQLLLNLQTK